MILDMNKIEKALLALKELTEDEWEEVMSHFCKYCGGDPGCQCWNDE